MKHILPILTAALLGVAAPVFAEFNFEVQWQPYKNTQGIYDGNAGKYFTIKVTGTEGETGSIYLTNTLNGGYDANQTELLDNVIVGKDENYNDVRVKVTDFGYTSKNKGSETFTMTSDHIVDLSESSSDPNMKNLNGSFNRNGFYLGEFTVGDVIEVSLTAVEVDADGTPMGDAVTVRSNNPDGQHNSNLGRSDSINYRLVNDLKKTNDVLLVGSLYYKTQLNFGIVGTTGDGKYVYGSMKEVVPGTVGSPLPGGVQIALIAGLFGLGFWYVRHRKSAVA